MAAFGNTVAVRSREAPVLIEAPPVARPQTPKAGSLVSVLLVTAAIYALPWMATSLGNRGGLPAIFGADFYAYLNFSHLLPLPVFPITILGTEFPFSRSLAIRHSQPLLCFLERRDRFWRAMWPPRWSGVSAGAC